MYAIGLTAPFGSGCTTTASILSRRLNYDSISLSVLLVERWKKRRRREPTRADLQAFGNELRLTYGAGVLARQAIERLEREHEDHSLSFDGIRNLGEIEALKEHYGRRFYLIALECPQSERWRRLERRYRAKGLSLADFNADNERDRMQEYAHGQQVQLCVDQADVLIVNNNRVGLRTLESKVIDFTQLATGEKPRYALAGEILMNLAHSAAHGSKCLKRQVGAVLVDAAPGEMGDVVGQGFNENPVGTSPCVEEPEYGADAQTNRPGRCYRDKARSEFFDQLFRSGGRCPKCGRILTGCVGPVPPWRCSNRRCAIDLEEYFWSERALTLCTAVHAEVAAIFSAGRRARGATLYTTTFPCFQCVEKIAAAGVKNVVFTEPYPDIRAAHRLELADIAFERFEGVRSSRFDEIFARARPYISEYRGRA